MISDFIDEQNGYLCLAPEEHEVAKLNLPDLPAKVWVVFSLVHKIRSNELFIAQVETAIKIAEFKYP